MLSSPFSYFSAHDVSRLPQPNEASDFFYFFNASMEVVFLEKSLLISTNRNTGTPKFQCKLEANPVQCENVPPDQK